MLRHQTIAGHFTGWSMQSSGRTNLKPHSREPPQAPLACPSHTAGPRPGQSPGGLTFGSWDLFEDNNNQKKQKKKTDILIVLGVKRKQAFIYFYSFLYWHKNMHTRFPLTHFFLLHQRGSERNKSHKTYYSSTDVQLCSGYLEKFLINIHNGSLSTSGLTDIKRAFITSALSKEGTDHCGDRVERIHRGPEWKLKKKKKKCTRYFGWKNGDI